MNIKEFMETEKDKIFDSQKIEEDLDFSGLRPQRLDSFIGQEKVKQNLKILIAAAKDRKEPIEHLLFCGPPGLGKTTLANIISNEMGVNIKITSGPAIERAADLAAIITNLKENDLFFIDEIHRLNRQVEEILYPAMEDFSLDIVIGKGPSAKSIRLDLPKFSLIGATTRAGLLTSPLRDRFGMITRLDFYKISELEVIIKQVAQVLKIEVEDKGAIEIAKRSRGTPRIAIRLLKRVRDFAQVKGRGVVTKEIADFALHNLGVDSLGLDSVDRKIIETVIVKFSGGPVGIDTLSASISEEVGTIEEVHEPYLMQIGFLKRTSRGRVTTRKAQEHLGFKTSGRLF